MCTHASRHIHMYMCIYTYVSKSYILIPYKHLRYNVIKVNKVYTVVWNKFTIGYFRVKFVHGKYFRPLESPMNKKHHFLFIVKNISFIQFSSCHTSNEIFRVEFFPNYGTRLHRWFLCGELWKHPKVYKKVKQVNLSVIIVDLVWFMWLNGNW